MSTDEHQTPAREPDSESKMASIKVPQGQTPNKGQTNSTPSTAAPLLTSSNSVPGTQHRSRSSSDAKSMASLSSNLNSNGNNVSSPSFQSTTLRARLSRNPSASSVSDQAKSKMKLKLQLSQSGMTMANLQTTPVFLSPKGTPTQSPDQKTDSFFPNYEAISNQSHLDTLLGMPENGMDDIGISPLKFHTEPAVDRTPQLDEKIKLAESRIFRDKRSSDIPHITTSDSSNNIKPMLSNPARSRSGTIPTNASISSSNSTNAISNHTHSSSSINPKSGLHQLQTKGQRLSSSGSTPSSANVKSPRSPFNKQNPKNPAFQALPEPVRPQTSILKSNFNTKFSQQYQQQEKQYLTGITKYRDRYRNNDDYYDKLGVSDIDDEAEPDYETSTTQDRESKILPKAADIPEAVKFMKINSEFDEEEDDYLSSRNDKNREYEALKALGQQIGSEFLGKNMENISEYSLDSNLLLDLLNRNDEIQLKNTDANSVISERLEWQSMLQTVLTGDVVTGEKTKIVKPLTTELEGENLLRVGYKEDFWLGIRAKLYGRSEEEQKRLVLYHRGLVDQTFDEIMAFKLELPANQQDMSYNDKVRFASEKVNHLLDKYEKCQELWRTQKEMETDKPQCTAPEFVNRINCLVAWTSVTDAVARESDVLKKWVGNDDLDILRAGGGSSSNFSSKSNLITRPSTESEIQDNHTLNEEGKGSTEKYRDGEHIFKDDRPFVERILKEKDIENLFNKRLFTTFSHWTIKAKTSYLEYHHYFAELGLPSYLDNLFVLTNFPSKLMKEIIKTRLAYAKKVKNPTMMMIDQILDDLKMYLRLALEIRISMLEYCAPVEGWISFPDYQDPEFDNTLIDCVNHYMCLLNKKLLFSPKGSKSFRTFKEPEILEKEWLFLQNMGFYINGISSTFSTQMSTLFIKLINRLYTFVQHQIQGPPSDGYKIDSQRLVRWYSSSIENFGQLRRRFIRFEIHLLQYFQNAVQFKILPHKTQKFFTLLKDSNHALFHCPAIAEEGIYIFVSESLVNRPYDVECILKNTYIGVDFSKIPQRHMEVIESYHPTIHYNAMGFEGSNEEEDGNYNLDYVIAITPPKALMWDGAVVSFENVDSIDIGQLMRGNAMFLTRGGPNAKTSEIFDIFKQFTSDAIGSNTQLCCSVPALQVNYESSLKFYSRITCLTIDSTSAIRNQCRGVGDCQELVNNVFIFARDVGRDSIRNSPLNVNLQAARSTIILRLIKMAIEWLSFIVDDCSPTDPKTFRWCVSALEFAMDVTRGFNILTLDSEKFYRLKDKVAGCMSLLIAHFDIMGARAKELQKRRMQNYDLTTQKDIFTLDCESLGSLRQHIMHQIKSIEEERRHLQVEQKSVGRVLDGTDMENQLLTYLASSFSSVSIRWQKGKFLGGGTFGSVYASVNLDTGGPMAVKEIRFQDRQSIKTVVPAIKGEMSVLELLSHPNIVQFFGVEVHRDRVYIFMEYCSGGSLAGLLEYGRIEDEIVIQLYTLQMLEALAYLHQFGIVHRDVKPDNILLDHMGVIKFVDFGSAKVIAIPNSSSTSGSGNNTSTTTLNGNGEDSNSGSAAKLNTNFTNTSNASVYDIPTPSEHVGSPSSTMSSTVSFNDHTSSSTSALMQTLNTLNRLSAAPNGSEATSLSASSISAFTGDLGDGKSRSKASYSGAGNEADADIVDSILESKKSHVLTGTPMYMAPETIRGEGMGKFGAMDIWSLGCCVLEMSTGRRPWSNLDNEFAVMYHIAAGHLPQFPSANELSAQGQEFLAKCLTIDPTKRASAAELLQDPWIQAIRMEAFSDRTGSNANESILE